MYEVENKMVAEGNYEMTKQAYIEMYKTAYEVDSPRRWVRGSLPPALD